MNEYDWEESSKKRNREIDMLFLKAFGIFVLSLPLCIILALVLTKFAVWMAHLMNLV